MQDIFFRSEEHKQRLLSSLADIGKIFNGVPDTEYAAALYILTSDPFMWDVVSRYVSCDGIRIKGILKKVPMSTGEAALVKLAGNLFNGIAAHVDPLELIPLDETNFTIVLTALKLRREGLQLS